MIGAMTILRSKGRAGTSAEEIKMAEFLRNCWYVACAGTEIDKRPLARTILDTPVVLYRLADGSPAALQDRCPHRFVPLSMGRVVGNNLQCIYHGLQFDQRGNCVLNPHAGSASAPFRVGSYPVVERYGYVWIWPGEAKRAHPDLLPDLPFLQDETRFRTVRGYLVVAAHHELISDNLLDLSHVEFLHPLLSREEGVAAHRIEFYQDGNAVFANRWKPNSKPNGFLRMFSFGPDERSDARANMKWLPPGILRFDLGACSVGGEPEEGLCTPAAHLLTPETAHRTHYFWAQSRNQRLDDPQLDQKLWAETSRIFDTEDRPVIEAQQRAMGQEVDLMKLKPLLFKPDTPTVMARRTLARLIKEENAARERDGVGQAGSSSVSGYS